MKTDHPAVDLFYDFRSPFAYFAFQRLSIFIDAGVKVNMQPVSVSALLNFQVNRDPLAEVIDPMSPAKRQHFMSDIFRLIEYWQIPFSPPKPAPPVCHLAMAIAALLSSENIEHESFIQDLFLGIWQEQQDAEDTCFLKSCLQKNGHDVAFLDKATDKGESLLIDNSVKAYALGVFGTPTFICDGQLYFGADRMALLVSRLP